ncbi:MAG: Gfo/Idh/MocA family oxidoreductase [Rhodospirillum sp.]|nr:Gfo/Idh/MocA family oxidoreductase [Rhodospirillum sp.]MCF8489114.1 Gfo/Idh/MocA family oxidoreductase [Rhodospirillum sp.]MCF8498904.1 Gfo/Idh/MocA family oxidoreductase [Rhodospirillum sp.]
MKFLVVGLGSMGKRRIRNLTHLGETDLIGFDMRQDRREEVEKTFGMRTFADLDEAMADGPGALVISTPPGLHMPYALAAVTAGKHFFAEADTVTEGMAEVQRIANEKGLVAAPSMTMRFHPAVKMIKELLVKGAIGKVLTFTHHCGQYLPDWHPWEDYRTFYVSKKESGACREIVPFELVWLNWLIGDVAQVQGMRDKLTDLEADIDDVYHLNLRYTNGVLGHLLVDVVARSPLRSIRILGSEGTLEWTASEKMVRVYDTASKSWTEYAEPVAQVVDGYSELSVEGMYIEEMNTYAKACQGEGEYAFTLPEDEAILEVLYAAERSAESGEREVLAASGQGTGVER